MMILALAALLLAAANDIPAENQTKGERPGLEPAAELSKHLLHAIETDDPSVSADDFFPAEPFVALKNMPRSEDYYRQLRQWYGDDIHKEHERVKARGKLTFKSFRAGGCQWKAVGSETNKIPYWSCYGNHFSATTEDGKTIDFGVRVLINWGKSWYVTHLLPLPKK